MFSAPLIGMDKNGNENNLSRSLQEQEFICEYSSHK